MVVQINMEGNLADYMNSSQQASFNVKLTVKSLYFCEPYTFAQSSRIHKLPIISGYHHITLNQAKQITLWLNMMGHPSQHFLVLFSEGL